MDRTADPAVPDNSGTGRALFQASALASLASRSSDEPALTYPVTMGRLAVGLVALVALVVGFASLVHYTQYLPAAGTVRPQQGDIVLVAGQRGTVHFAPRLGPGTKVHRDELLAWIDVAPSATAVNSLSNDSLQSLRAKRESLLRSTQLGRAVTADRRASVLDQIAQLERQRRSIVEQQALLSSRLATRETDLQRNTELQASGYVSASYVSTIQGDVLSLKVGVTEAAQRLASLDQALAALRHEASHQTQQELMDDARNSQDVAEVDSRIATATGNQRVELRAPDELDVTALHVVDRSFVVEETSVVTTVRRGTSREIACNVDAQAVARIRPRQRVRIRYPSYPHLLYGTFEGEVVSADDSPWLGDAAHAAAPDGTNGPKYRVIVRPLEQEPVTSHGVVRLVAGMDAEVQFPRADRTLLQWLLVGDRDLRGGGR